MRINEVYARVSITQKQMEAAILEEDEEKFHTLVSDLSAYLGYVRNELNIPIPLFLPSEQQV